VVVVEKIGVDAARAQLVALVAVGRRARDLPAEGRSASARKPAV
jgi:hypothetical protein